MRLDESSHLTRSALLEYFLRAATPREDWRIGMEVEKIGRDAATGAPLPYEGATASVRGVLEWIRSRRGGDPILEGDHLIGVDGDWGTISLEPGGQIEWSSHPLASLDALAAELDAHLAALARCGAELGVRWLDVGVDPELPVSRMVWMPKARYAIMARALGARGRLAHRMMTQTASIQCSFDYAEPEDWHRKFKAAVLLGPVAAALFANSPRADGAPSGFRSFRRAIWRETDDSRSGVPSSLFAADFTLDSWLDYVLGVPTLFLHRGRGLVPAGGVPFGALLERSGCQAVRFEDWETHLSTVFTDVRCYTYIEVRGADAQPDEIALAVPALWTGILYHPAALARALELGQEFASHGSFTTAMDAAARDGLAARLGATPARELAAAVLGVATRGLREGAVGAGASGAGLAALARLAARHDLEVAG